jgi:hypothetical protein
MTGKEKPAICYSTKTDRYKAKILPSNVGRIFILSKDCDFNKIGAIVKFRNILKSELNITPNRSCQDCIYCIASVDCPLPIPHPLTKERYGQCATQRMGLWPVTRHTDST